MTRPFIDASVPEVCARVALAWVAYNYRHRTTENETPARIIAAAIADLPSPRNPIVLCALMGLRHSLAHKHITSRQWLDHAIASSRLGCGFRRCYFDDYKASRRR